MRLWLTIGQVKDWRLSDAREKAKELAVLCSQGIDPVIEKAKRIESDLKYGIESKRKEIKFRDACQADKDVAYGVVVKVMAEVRPQAFKSWVLLRNLRKRNPRKRRCRVQIAASSELGLFHRLAFDMLVGGAYVSTGSNIKLNLNKRMYEVDIVKRQTSGKPGAKSAPKQASPQEALQKAAPKEAPEVKAPKESRGVNMQRG